MNDERSSIVTHRAWLDAEFAELPDVVGLWVGKAHNFDEVVHRVLHIPQNDRCGLIETLRSASRP